MREEQRKNNGCFLSYAFQVYACRNGQNAGKFGDNVLTVQCGIYGHWFSSAANYVIGSALSFFLNKYFTFSEIIFVDDGPKDKTLNILRNLSHQDGRIHYISFGILGQYVVKIHTEVKQRPLYIIREAL